MCSNKEWNLKITALPESIIIQNAIQEITAEFQKAVSVDSSFIVKYEEIYKEQLRNNKDFRNRFVPPQEEVLKPNAMQIDALANIEEIRNDNKRKALLISATGTGKTHLSAFDANKIKPNRLLFVVHRGNIARAAMKIFETVFGGDKTMGMYSGNRRELDKDFIFSTIQTISRDEHLAEFSPSHFDYIVIDETHRAGAMSYQRILDYFSPKFLLGMTATPERTDGFDIFNIFNHTIAYEIRLHRALEEGMLCPFHYYGVTDISVNGEVLDEDASINLLTSDERTDRIIEKSEFYGCDDGSVRGLIFCSRIEECKELSERFNRRGYRTLALTGDSSEEERSDAINRLESDVAADRLDYIFTVDFFNEGIDIPRVNQVIMLRPTQSAIIFVQQLGRGLRKIENKEFLTVTDFIGNYKNNYFIPIALYGDTSYNKDTLRKMMSSGSSLIPGDSTINFDEISRERIFAAIDSTNMQLKKDLVKDYELLKFKLGRIPMMIDFIDHGSRDPQLYVNYSRSYFNFLESQEDIYAEKMDEMDKKVLELFSKEINNAKRVEESLILNEIIAKGRVEIDDILKLISDKYNYNVSEETIASSVRNLNFMFIRESKDRKIMSVQDIYGINTVNTFGDALVVDDSFAERMENETFKIFLKDNVDYAIRTFDDSFERDKYYDGFVLYRKYSRKDVFRILNWDENPVAPNVGGYIVSSDKTNMPIFVNYEKEEHISGSTKYDDRFINNSEFEWMSKSNRTLNSPEIQVLQNHTDRPRLPLFIKKSNDEGDDFYYMGDVTPIDDSFEQTTLTDDNDKEVSVVKLRFSMDQPVDDFLYDYITKT